MKFLIIVFIFSLSSMASISKINAEASKFVKKLETQKIITKAIEEVKSCFSNAKSLDDKGKCILKYDIMNTYGETDYKKFLGEKLKTYCSFKEKKEKNWCSKQKDKGLKNFIRTYYGFFSEKRFRCHKPSYLKDTSYEDRTKQIWAGQTCTQVEAGGKEKKWMRKFWFLFEDKKLKETRILGYHHYFYDVKDEGKELFQIWVKENDKYLLSIVNKVHECFKKAKDYNEKGKCGHVLDSFMGLDGRDSKKITYKDSYGSFHSWWCLPSDVYNNPAKKMPEGWCDKDLYGGWKTIVDFYFSPYYKDRKNFDGCVFLPEKETTNWHVVRRQINFKIWCGKNAKEHSWYSRDTEGYLNLFYYYNGIKLKDIRIYGPYFDRNSLK